MQNAVIDKQGDHIQVAGELNFHTVVDLWKQRLLLMSDASALHFDFSQVTASNSAGVALMLEWIRYAKEKHCAIDFKNIPAQLYSILTVSGIEDLVVTSKQ